MKKINVLDLLYKYRGWVERGEIQFLPKATPEQKTTISSMNDLISTFTEASKKGSIGEHIDWREAHKKGLKLWQNLASFSLNSIDKNSKGNSELFNYLDAATKFEDLLYGLEPYYRDHTLHSLWVFLLGEHLLRDHLPELHNNLNWFLYNDIEHENKSYKQKLVTESKKIESELFNEVNRSRDAIWCIMALCHDLGYSLAKLNKLNEKVRDVLKFFDIPSFHQVGYSLDVEHHYIAAQFLELMAMDVRIVPSIDKEDVIVKCYRDDSTYWRLCRALEKKQHGILSSYLLYKILSIFAETWVRGSAEEWGLDDKEAVDNIVRGDILFAISQHEFDFAHLCQLGGLADILVIADELEEFSRFGRPLLSRKYYPTTADAQIDFLKSGNWVNIQIKYEVAEHHSLEAFFKRKAEKLCKFFSLDQDPEEYSSIAKIYTIKSIKLVAEKNGKQYYVNIFKNSKNDIAYLPTTIIDGKKIKQGKYHIQCYDDKIKVFYDHNKEVLLDKWFETLTD
jgi:hypothetical protein